MCAVFLLYHVNLYTNCTYSGWTTISVLVFIVVKQIRLRTHDLYNTVGLSALVALLNYKQSQLGAGHLASEFSCISCVLVHTNL